MAKQVAHWVALADDDLDFLREMPQSRQPKYHAFFAEMALEKMLKAHVVRATGTVPPRIHNLVRLAELAGLELGPEKTVRYRELQVYQIDARYGPAASTVASRAEAMQAVEDCLKEIEWLRQLLAR